jgi:DNA replication protein DnaC
MQQISQSLGKATQQISHKKNVLGKQTCATCGKDYEIFTQQIAGREIRFDFCWPCKKAQEDASLVATIQYDKATGRHIDATAKQEKVKHIFAKYSLLNPDLIDCSFKNYELTNPNEKRAYDDAVRYVQIFEVNNPKNLVFYGSYGVGKSHLAKSICDALTDRGNTAIFVNIPKLLKLFKSTYQKNAEITENELFRYLETVDCLVLDDIGTGKMSEWAIDDILFPLLDARQGRNTVFTTNNDPLLTIDKDNPDNPTGLPARIGARNVSRVLANSNVVKLFGRDRRTG